MHDRRGVFVDAEAEPDPACLHQRQHAPDAPAPQEMLVDEHIGIEEAEAAVDLVADAQGSLQHLEHVLRIAKHHLAHHRRAGRGAGDDSTAAIHGADRIEQRSRFTVRQQGIDDALLGAAGEVDGRGRADLVHPLRIARLARTVAAVEQRRYGDELGLCALLAQGGDGSRRGRFWIFGRRRQHREAGRPAAGEGDQARPHGGVVVVERTSDRNHVAAARGTI